MCLHNLQTAPYTDSHIPINHDLSQVDLKHMYAFLSFTGPKLPMPLRTHTMVQLGNGQAIIGGWGNFLDQEKIYLFSCMNENCSIHQLDQTLSLPRYWFVAIPIPDTLSGCITGGKIFHKIWHANLQLETYPNL